MTKPRFIVLAAAAGFVALVAWALWPPSEKAFFDYVAERRAAGLPTTFEELDAPMPPSDENGAADLEAAIRTIVHFGTVFHVFTFPPSSHRGRPLVRPWARSSTCARWARGMQPRQADGEFLKK